MYIYKQDKISMLMDQKMIVVLFISEQFEKVSTRHLQPLLHQAL